MASRFVRPDVDVLTISNGDTLTVKKRLTAGEQLESYARASIDDANGLRANRLKSGLALVTAYLIDWSLKDDAGNIVPIRDLAVQDLEAKVCALDYASFVEIKDAIEQHEQRQDAARAQEKNGQGGENTSSAISPSPSDSAGA